MEKNSKCRFLQLDHARNFFLDLKHKEFSITFGQLEECFNFSMMTVLDEANKIEKYEYIVFVEFLEMLCRIAIIGIKIQDLIEYKVHLLFEIIWDKMIERGEFDLTDHPLKEVDESNW